MATAARRTIFVGNIEDDTTPEHLASAFAPFGAVTEIQIPPDPQLRDRHRNFAFVTFTSANAALDAVDNMNLNVLPTAPQRILKVNLARSAKAGAGGRVGGLAPSAAHDEETAGVWGSRKAIWESEDWLREHENKTDGDQAEPAPPEGEGS